MAYRIWLQCFRRDVKTLKNILEQTKQLYKDEKITANDTNDFMLIPTQAQWDSAEIEAALKDQLLTDLLSDASFDGYLDAICLPLRPICEASIPAGSRVIRQAAATWLQILPFDKFGLDEISVTELVALCPKRWSVYRPLLLLPTGSFQSAAWDLLFQELETEHRNSLWSLILTAIGKAEGGLELTHLAINSGIPLSQDGTESKDGENILRSPTGLVMLYGDFGPDVAERDPTQVDFDEAFWVSVKQNGVYQTWAPRYTMFSRGNIKEKGRIMSFHEARLEEFPKREQARSKLADCAAVDLYAGIGYFTFSYAAMGIGKVLCWEINPWSVEGLRRGTLENKYGNVRVIKGDDLQKPFWETIHDNDRILVFEEGNELAARRIEELRIWESAQHQSLKIGEIIHVNCGFLPSSEASWKTAWALISEKMDTWLHLHENVGIEDIEMRRQVIEGQVRTWVLEDPTKSSANVEHVELVKTFAPGVWHCVFDVHVDPKVEKK